MALVNCLTTIFNRLIIYKASIVLSIVQFYHSFSLSAIRHGCGVLEILRLIGGECPLTSIERSAYRVGHLCILKDNF
jgi:hypothetical protein